MPVLISIDSTLHSRKSSHYVARLRASSADSIRVSHCAFFVGEESNRVSVCDIHGELVLPVISAFFSLVHCATSACLLPAVSTLTQVSQVGGHGRCRQSSLLFTFTKIRGLGDSVKGSYITVSKLLSVYYS